MNKVTSRLAELDKKYVWHPFTEMAGWLGSEPVIIERADGFYLYDTEGRRYIDGISSLWCNVHGHRVKEIDDAVSDQLKKVAHSTLLGLGQTKSIELAEKLVEITPAKLQKVFYSDSGATAVEIALKIAYQYFYNRGERGRRKFVALSRSYHGDTIGSVSLGGIDTFHRLFRPLLFEAYFAASPHPYRYEGTGEECKMHSLREMEEVLAAHSDEIAAVVVEPLVQGAAGMIVHPPGFLSAVRRLTEEYKVLLIADEVATGFGRTGSMFACEREGVEPDMMCLAKGISGGYLPVAATLTSKEIFEAFLSPDAAAPTFYHGHTYTGNALGCAAALASLELFERRRVVESLPEKIELVGRYFEEISQMDYVGDVRRCGMMGGIELVADRESKRSFEPGRKVAERLCFEMRKRSAMMRPLGDTLIFMPAVGMDFEILEELAGIVRDAIKDDLPRLVDAR